MSVIINDLEIIAPLPKMQGPAEALQEQRSAAPQTRPPSSVRSEDLERAQRRFHRRRMRLWAS